jgi:hypothetical protein
MSRRFSIEELYDRAFECHRLAGNQSTPVARGEWDWLARRYLWIALNRVTFEIGRHIPAFKD